MLAETKCDARFRSGKWHYLNAHELPLALLSDDFLLADSTQTGLVHSVIVASAQVQVRTGCPDGGRFEHGSNWQGLSSVQPQILQTPNFDGPGFVRISSHRRNHRSQTLPSMRICVNAWAVDCPQAASQIVPRVVPSPHSPEIGPEWIHGSPHYPNDA